jgi:hypothetical protein
MTFRNTAMAFAVAFFCQLAAYPQSRIRPQAANPSDSARFQATLQRAIGLEATHYDSSLLLAQQALEQATRAGQTRWMLQSAILAGKLYFQLGNEATALQYYFQCLDLAAQLADSLQRGKAFYQIGTINQHVGNSRLAVSFFAESYTHFRAAGSQSEAAKALNAIGHLYQQRGRASEATGFYQRGLALARQANDPVALAQLLANLGEMALGEGKQSLALERYLEALSHAERTTDPYLVPNLLIKLGYLYQSRGQPERSIAYAQRALEQAQQNRSVQQLDNVAKAYVALADSHFAIEDPAQAFVYQKLAGHLHDSLTHLRNAEAVAKVNAGFEVARRQQEMEQLRRRERENAARQEQVRVYFMAGMALLLLVSLLLMAYNRRKAKLNQVLARQNAELEAQKQQIARQSALVREANEEINLTNQALAQALAEISQKNTALHRQAEELDAAVQARTAALLSQNEKLVEYGFINAHKLRAPVASILGLSRLLMMLPLQPQEFEIAAALDQTTKQLDEIVHEIKRVLETAEYREDNLTLPVHQVVVRPPTTSDPAQEGGM